MSKIKTCRNYFYLIAFFFLTSNLYSQKCILSRMNDNKWVDSVFNGMTLEERIGQLIMIRGSSSNGHYDLNNLVYEIKNYNIGGVCFFKGTPYGQATVTNTLQAISKTPLLISIDGEWGIGMRIDSVHSFPHQIVMGAMNNDSLVYQFGAEVARQCKCMGIHINFAPDIDVNSNPRNPVIGSRSFGEDKINVAKKGWAYMKGMQDNGVIACAKHFPGHGETDNDSHYTLPVIKLSKQLIDSIHLYPFRTLIDSGVMSVMIAHL